MGGGGGRHLVPREVRANCSPDRTIRPRGKTAFRIGTCTHSCTRAAPARAPCCEELEVPMRRAVLLSTAALAGALALGCADQHPMAPVADDGGRVRIERGRAGESWHPWWKL
jgi:hypothetical protein